MIEDLFVLKPWRRRCVARFLVYTMVDYLEGLGAGRVQLEMWSANRAAQALYQALGFAPIDETEIAVGRYV